MALIFDFMFLPDVLNITVFLLDRKLLEKKKYSLTYPPNFTQCVQRIFTPILMIPYAYKTRNILLNSRFLFFLNECSRTGKVENKLEILTDVPISLA